MLNTDTAANGSTTEVLSSTPTQAIKENFPNSSLEVYIPTTDPSPTGSTNDPQTYKDAIFVDSVEPEEHSPASPSESTKNFDFELNSVETFQSITTEDSFIQDNKNLISSYNTFYISLIIGILLLLFIILLILVLLRYKTVLKDRFVGKITR